MKNLTSDTADLIQELLPALDELIALLEYYDNATYRATVEAIASALQSRGLNSYDDRGLWFDPDRHEIHNVYPKSDCDRDAVCKTHTRGYCIGDQVIRRSIVDIFTPKENDIEHTDT